MADQDRKLMVSAWRETMAFDSRSRLAEIGCPTLVVAASCSVATRTPWPLLRKEDRTEDHDPIRAAGKTLIDLLAQTVAQGEDRLVVSHGDARGGEGFGERTRDRSWSLGWPQMSSRTAAGRHSTERLSNKRLHRQTRRFSNP
jgi:hypothetical protein